MQRRWIERITRLFELRQYDMTAHATGEMADDEFVIADIEHAIGSGEVVRIRKDDPRGNICVVYGKAADGLDAGRSC